jgi:hypothetical protein
MDMQTGFISVYSNLHTPFGRTIGRFTGSHCEKTGKKEKATHVDMLVVEKGYSRIGANKAGFIWRPSVIEEPFDFTEPTLRAILCLRRDLFDTEDNWRKAHEIAFARGLTKLGSSYDLLAVLHVGLDKIGLGFIADRLGHAHKKFMCSEFVSWCFRPPFEGYNGARFKGPNIGITVFSEDPRKRHHETSPQDILCSPFTEIVLDLEKERKNEADNKQGVRGPDSVGYRHGASCYLSNHELLDGRHAI